MKRLILASWQPISPSRVIKGEKMAELLISWPDYNNDSYRDQLTDLPNRRAYENAITLAIKEAETQEAAFGVIIFDIDYFKSVNDTYGHVVGDAVLQVFASRLKNTLRSIDFISRYGGEEFVVITPSYKQSFQIAERVRLVVSQAPLYCEGESIPITCSFGCAVFPIDGYKHKDVFIKADKALYQAKNNGRNQGVQWREGGGSNCFA